MEGTADIADIADNADIADIAYLAEDRVHTSLLNVTQSCVYPRPMLARKKPAIILNRCHLVRIVLDRNRLHKFTILL